MVLSVISCFLKSSYMQVPMLLIQPALVSVPIQRSVIQKISRGTERCDYISNVCQAAL